MFESDTLMAEKWTGRHITIIVIIKRYLHVFSELMNPFSTNTLVFRNFFFYWQT